MLHVWKRRQINNAASRNSRQEIQCCATQQPAGAAMLRRAESGANGLMVDRKGLMFYILSSEFLDFSWKSPHRIWNLVFDGKYFRDSGVWRKGPQSSDGSPTLKRWYMLCTINFTNHKTTASKVALVWKNHMAYDVRNSNCFFLWMNHLSGSQRHTHDRSNTGKIRGATGSITQICTLISSYWRNNLYVRWPHLFLLNECSPNVEKLWAKNETGSVQKVLNIIILNQIILSIPYPTYPRLQKHTQLVPYFPSTS